VPTRTICVSLVARPDSALLLTRRDHSIGKMKQPAFGLFGFDTALKVRDEDSAG
jgi:hypothetical protein